MVHRKETINQPDTAGASAESTPSNRKHAMNKGQLIESIRNYNTSVQLVFLEQFSEADLREYLARLESAHKKQLLIAGWVKPRQAMKIAS